MGGGAHVACSLRESWKLFLLSYLKEVRNHSHGVSDQLVLEVHAEVGMWL